MNGGLVWQHCSGRLLSRLLRHINRQANACRSRQHTTICHQCRGCLRYDDIAMVLLFVVIERLAANDAMLRDDITVCVSLPMAIMATSSPERHTVTLMG